jgi:hypothetical protein
MRVLRPLMLLALIVPVAACSVRDDGNNTTADAATAPEPSGVTREEVAAPTPTPTPLAAAVIQSQPGPENNTVALNKVAVTGDILTVSMTFSGSKSCCVHIPVDDVSVIDDATSQRISVLKDNTGKYMAAPLEVGGRNVGPADYDTPGVVWFKFPAPPATTKTVSIAIPGVAPFDAVPVTR